MSDDLARMDATAQAELVSSGEASPLELIDAAIERAESRQPGDQRDHPRPLRAGPREGRRRGSRRALQGGPVPAQGPRRRQRRRAPAYGNEGPQGGELPLAGRQHARAALPRRRPDHDRQDEHPRARDRRDDRAAGLRGLEEPLGHDPLDRRLERRIGRCRGGRDRADGPCQRRWRLDPDPRVQQRPRRPEADPPADQRGPDRRRRDVGGDRRALRLTIGARHRQAARGRPRRRAGRSLRRAGAAAPLHGRARRRQRRAADRRARPVADRGRRGRGGLRRGGREGGEARRVTRPRGRRRLDRRRAADRGGGTRSRGQLPDAVGGRSGRDTDPARDAPRPSGDRGRRREADLGHGGDRSRARRRPLPARRRHPPGHVADGRRLVRDRLRPAADADDGRGRSEARARSTPRCPTSPRTAAACPRARSRRSST